MFDPFERTVRRTLRQLSKQRVRLVLQPGNIWVVDHTGSKTDDTDAALLTCFMRGWVEPLEHALPHAKLKPDGSLPERWEGVETQYRLTSAGWTIIHRTRTIALVALAISAMSFLTALTLRLN